MRRVTIYDALADLEALLRQVHDTGATVVLTTDYRHQARAKLVPAGPDSPGGRVNLTEARKRLYRLADQAGRGESAVLTARRRPLARLVPLAWTGDGPEPDRDPELWATVTGRINGYLDADGVLIRSKYTPDQINTIRALAAPVAYDMYAAAAAHGFGPGDVDINICDGAVWMAASLVR